MTEEARTNETDSRAADRRSQRPDIVNFVDNYGDPVEILANIPAPDYDSGPIKAYQARSKEKGVQDCFALVCEKHLVPRSLAAESYKNIRHPGVTPLLSHGVVYWPPSRQERYVFLYRQPPGKRIFRDGEEAALGWRQDSVMENFVKPTIELFKEFRDLSFTHGGIRPSNMFAVSAGGKISQIVFSDCLSLPGSYLQPALYEPIERALAQPAGRGEGTLADDIYSFGVTLAVLLRAHDPLKGKSDYEVIRDKIEQGSYGAITGADRFKGSILELLRGVLHDDAKERWTIEEMMTWLDGRRLSPKQSLKQKKAARPLIYNEEKYLLSPLLAMDVDINPQETVRIVESGDLDQWLERSLEDEEMTARVAASIKAAREKGTGPGYEDRLASNLSIALDPLAPMRLKGLRLMGDGIGTTLAEAMVLRQDLQRFNDLFAQNLAFNWLNNSKNPALDMGSLVTRFDQCRNYIRHGKVGYGIERCVYALCPEAPCLSEKLRDYYVTTPEQLIKAFEDICRKSSMGAMFLDRQAIAFLSVKEPKVIDSFLFELGAVEEHRRVLGNLKCLAAIQKRFNLPMFPEIAKIFVEALSSVYARYHDREVRTKLEAAVKKFSVEGDLSKMATLLSNQEVMHKDTMAFRGSMREYVELNREYANLEMRLDDRNTFGKSAGKEVAAIVSSVIACIVILAMAIMALSSGSDF